MLKILAMILNALGVSGIFAQVAVKKIAIAGTAIAVFVSTTGILVATCSILISNIAVAMPASMNIAVSWFVPSNAVGCVSAYYAAMAARWVYDQKTKIIQYSLF